ncbi:acyltransferase family protein [Staphylococcus epidermidis]|uniref:acyltransferase family protein n=1 Tax=Staphylococcus epidermidis TaxID=1282 RepID=UPI001879C9CC|nr:acyltransferase family protein [Staphylococcus epidermidis]MBE7345342.1 acyltransferase family protein [Staphylococcus epidermidis]MBF2140238.1 acyltransferase family protein [Staphylococcus epidermidis]MBF2295495.1 acyltransferase family protein [Staphylococcus epidermidis]MBF2304718.1 acyltransferase family protein [Staphylococcus epidermidis]MBF2313180.1 acyltransferase family protein [Staphylococcus epidermidis]
MTAIKDRDYFFDNARAILIFLVVLGHLLQPYTSEDKFLQALYLLIYSFHMPTFLFISGYFAKNLDKPNYLEKIAKKLLLPYVIFFVFFSLYYYFTGKEDAIQLDPFNPVFALWFLLTLFFFHVVLVIVRRYNPYIVLFISVLVSVLAGFSGNIDSYMSISRTIVFFPIFFIGHLVTQSHTEKLRNKKWIPISIIILITFFIGYTIHPINGDWLLGSTPYTSLESNGEDVYSPLKRLLLYVIILLTMCAFLNLMPQTKRIYTYIGQRTMFVYLLHGIVIGVIRGFGLYPFKDQISIFTYLYLFISASVIVLILSSKWVCKWTNPFINLKRPSQFKN